jgi:selenocysteine lyase/cysteine desulfurase
MSREKDDKSSTALTRRSLITSAVAAPLAMAPAKSAATGPRTLPLKADFEIAGIFLNSAFTHPVPRPVRAAMHEYAEVRFSEPRRLWVTQEVENEAAGLFARLINAAPGDIAAVPSTMIGENLVCAALGIGPGTGVVTDAFHYFASLAMYGEMRRAGVEVVVVPPRGNRISPEDIAAAITSRTRLVALSLVSSHSGFVHDLKAICALAHRRLVPVYADVIQAAGALAIDVRDSQVDFACSGGYKWLQGDFGAAFLYVRPDVVPRLRRVQTGWRQVNDYRSHAFPGDTPGPAEGEWRMSPASAGGLFEVSSPSHAALWALRAAITYVLDLGIAAIESHRHSLMAQLYGGMTKLGHSPLTPVEQNSPVAAFLLRGDHLALRKRLNARGIAVGTGPNYIRVSPSVFNDIADIDALLDALRG